MAQTDMMRFLDETGNKRKAKARIREFAKKVKDNKKPQNPNNGKFYHRPDVAIAVWEFAHMNLEEIENFDDLVGDFHRRP